jgi:hypothetical protein
LLSYEERLILLRQEICVAGARQQKPSCLLLYKHRNGAHSAFGMQHVGCHVDGEKVGAHWTSWTALEWDEFQDMQGRRQNSSLPERPSHCSSETNTPAFQRRKCSSLSSFKDEKEPRCWSATPCLSSRDACSDFCLNLGKTKIMRRHATPCLSSRDACSVFCRIWAKPKLFFLFSFF